MEELSGLIQGCVYTKEGVSIEGPEALEIARTFLIESQEKQGIVYFVGNGGSAGIASHFCADILKTLQIPASTLFDSNVLTCIGNDCGYENVFSLPLKTLMKKEDVLIAISSSGKSPNILNAVKVAREKSARIITFSGFSSDNPLRQAGDLNFWLDRCDYGLVETGHFFLLHTIVDSWKCEPSSFTHNGALAYAR